MEPRQLPQEYAPTPVPRVERSPNGEFVAPNAEQGRDLAGERSESRPVVAEINQQVSSAMPSVLPAPVAPVVTDAATKPADDTPIVAADEDLIEKEWVDKAKQIISTTKDDPYRREQEIKRLQLDYVRKRYGKEIGVTEG